MVPDLFWEKRVPGTKRPTVTYFFISRSQNFAFGFEHEANVNIGFLVKECPNILLRFLRAVEMKDCLARVLGDATVEYDIGHHKKKI